MTDYLESSLDFMLPTDLNLFYCGKREKTLDHEYGPAVRSHFLIVFVNDGNATILSEEPNISLSSGDVFFMFPNRKIHYKALPGTRWTISWIGVYGSLVEKYIDMLGLTPERPVLRPSCPEKIEKILDDIYNSSLGKSISRKVKCLSLTQLFFSVLFEDFTEKKVDSSLMSEAMYFIRMNYDRGISSNDIAEKLNIDQSYFTRVFTKTYGMPPNKWLNVLRLEKACELLKTTDHPVKIISRSVGITDPLYFSRLFRQYKGVSPSEYRDESKW
ncbi:MAG: AraC family transcriptional regulator [Firmicutes bacterium]|nr:AraC family transcriptional regulator [Candidatus Colimorpha enterica]